MHILFSNCRSSLCVLPMSKKAGEQSARGEAIEASLRSLLCCVQRNAKTSIRRDIPSSYRHMHVTGVELSFTGTDTRSSCCREHILRTKYEIYHILLLCYLRVVLRVSFVQQWIRRIYHDMRGWITRRDDNVLSLRFFRDCQLCCTWYHIPK